jgi:hypothetical protein
MNTCYAKYETSITWESFYGYKATAKKEVYINQLLDWRLNLMFNKSILSEGSAKLTVVEYELEATDKLLDIANNIF